MIFARTFRTDRFDVYNARRVLNGFYKFIVSVLTVWAEVIRPYKALKRTFNEFDFRISQ